MRLRTLMFLLVAVLVGLMAAPVLAQDELPDLGGQTISVAVENAYLPFNFIDEATGEPAGWDYDAVGEICARLNCVPDYQQVAWEGLLVGVANGEFDVAADGITITEERDQVVDFSIGYISVDQVLLARIDEDRFSNAEEFAANEDLRIATQVGTTNFLTAVELVGEDRVQAFDQFGLAIEALISGDADAVMIDDIAGQGYVGVNADEVVSIGDPIVSDELGFAFPEGSELTAAFNAALESMMADGTLDEINATWFPPGDAMAADLPDLAGRVVTVAIENLYPPFQFIDEESGEAVGWEYDTLNEICARLNCELEYTQVSFEAQLAAIANAEFDLAANGFTITEEREQVVDFTVGYLGVDEVLLGRVGEERYTSVEEFVANDELIVGTQVGGTNFLTGIELVGEDRVQAYDQFGIAIEALVVGDVDAVIISSTAGQGYIGENDELLTVIGGSITSDELGFALQDGSDLLAAFNAALESMIADGTLADISATWFD
ncbi:MAG: transporter substrate-binding domain-containing protein [Chloroflexi bacterium]|nr:transporter substrate-binding domain-containing protein [Chloroflexota bacterium]